MPDLTVFPRGNVIETVFDRNKDPRGHEELDGSFVCNRDGDDPERRCIVVPYMPQPHKRRREIILPAGGSGYVQAIRQGERQNLLRAIAQGKAWLQEIINGNGVTLGAIAVRERKSERSIRMTLSLAFLDPKLIKLAIRGSLPRGFGTKRLTELPVLWPEQWSALGLPQPA